MFECMKRAHIGNGLTLDVLEVHWSILGHLCYSYLERAQSILLLPNTATISFLHCIFNNLAPRVCYVAASSFAPGSGKIRDPGNKLASSMPALLDACVIIYGNYVMVIIYPRWMHNDLQVALVGTKVDLTYTYEVR